MKFLPLFLLPLVHGTVCTAPMDLVFLLDSSASVRSSDFEIAKTFVKTIAGRYEMSDRAVHISLVNFANWAATIWDFADDASSSFEKLTAKIDAMPARGAEGNGNTCVAEGSSSRGIGMPPALPLTACLHTHTHTLTLSLSLPFCSHRQAWTWWRKKSSVRTARARERAKRMAARSVSRRLSSSLRTASPFARGVGAPSSLRASAALVIFCTAVSDKPVLLLHHSLPSPALYSLRARPPPRR